MTIKQALATLDAVIDGWAEGADPQDMKEVEEAIKLIRNEIEKHEI